jgi:hypothetical protein
MDNYGCRTKIAIANSAGVTADLATNSFIEGAQAQLGNVISGNSGDGVLIGNPDHLDRASTNNTIPHNWIGMGSDGTTQLSNTGWGVNFVSASNSGNFLKDNIIKKNTAGQVHSLQEYKNKIQDSNSIDGHNNTYGIFAGTQAGSPVLTSATVSGNNINILGTLASTPSSSFILEFFGNQNAVTPGYEQGDFFLGIITVTTDASGNATFSATFNAVYGSYVRATATGTGTDGYTSQFSGYVLITGESSLAAVGGFVWNDLNQNGLQDSGEPGMPGVLVSLYDTSNHLIATTTTDGTGHYLFTNLATGQYYVQFMLPAGYVFTQPYQGSDALNSHADQTTGQTETFTLIAGEVNPFLSAGLVLAHQSGGQARPRK